MEEDVCGEEGKGHLQRDGDDEVGEGRRERLPETTGARLVGPEDVAVVRESAEGALDDVPLEERDVDRVERGKDLEDRDEDDGREEEEIRADVLDDRAAAAG